VTYEQYCQKRAEILNGYLCGKYGYFQTRWLLMQASARYANDRQLRLAV